MVGTTNHPGCIRTWGPLSTHFSTDRRPAARWPPATIRARRVNDWSNWDRRYQCDPAFFARPRGTGELANVLEQAEQNAQTVRVAGSGHSFTPLVPTSGTLISLEHMNRVLGIDTTTGLVRVEAGITIRELNSVLDRCGLAFENLGDIDAQTISGAITTGTHGTGARLGNMPSQIQSMEMMLADGQLVTLDANTFPDAWNAARVSLGALGIITTVTIQTVPAFRLLGVERPIPLEFMLENLDRMATEHDHLDMYWFPYTDSAFVRYNDRTDDPLTPRSQARRYFDEVIFMNGGMQGFARLGRVLPSLVPRLNRLETMVARPSRRVDVSHRIFCSPRLVRFTEMEYSIPRENATEALLAVRAAINRSQMPISFPIEVRFAAADTALLSPGFGRDSCYIAFHVFDGMEYEPYFRMVEAILDGFGARPHWGKQHFQTPATLRERYPEWDRFQAVRARMDPIGRFTNAEVERVLGPPPGVG
jgi:FAD-linked oxidoreductase